MKNGKTLCEVFAEENKAMENTLLNELKHLREHINHTEIAVRALQKHQVFKAEQKFEGQHNEMKSHIILAFRHLEDARMRLGKVAQWYDDGVSCYDKGEEPKC